MLGPDGLSRFEDLSRREAARTAILYAFDLIEHDGEDLRNLPFLDRKAALAWLLRDTEAGILLNEHVPSASFPRRSMARIDPGRPAPGSRSGIPPALPRSGSGARSGIGDLTKMCG